VREIAEIIAKGTLSESAFDANVDGNYLHSHPRQDTIRAQNHQRKMKRVIKVKPDELKRRPGASSNEVSTTP